MKFIDETKLEIQYDTEPFTHVVIDNFLKEETLFNLLGEIDELTIDKSYYYGHESIEKNKYAFKNGLNRTLAELFEELNSDEFITILEKKFNINNKKC